MTAIVEKRAGFTNVDVVNRFGGLVSRRRFSTFIVALVYAQSAGCVEVRCE